MKDSPLMDHIEPSLTHLINREAKISEFISPLKQWNLSALSALNDILPKEIINKIKAFTIRVTKR